MLHQVKKKQYTSRFCFACGEENQSGLHCRFYELDDGQIVGVFAASREHCSYPDRMHGGLISAVLDEVIGRAILIEEPDTFGVTVELNVRFKKPVPLETELRCVGRLIRNQRLLFEAEGEILLPDGTVAATAYGKYMKQPLSVISSDFSGERLMYNSYPDDKTAIELP